MGHAAPQGLACELATRQQHIVHDGEVAPLPRRLKCPDESEPRDNVRTLADQLLSRQPDAAGIRPPEAGHEINHRTLPRAVRSDEAGHLALRNRQSAFPYPVHAAERFRQSPALEQGLAAPAPLPPAPSSPPPR